MVHSNALSGFSASSILTAGLLLVGGTVVAQTKAATMPDAQIEANVLKALAGAPQLADQSITSTTVYGTVTLNGMVRDEPSRDLAEHLAANAAGVQKVVDQLTIAVPGAGEMVIRGRRRERIRTCNPTARSPRLRGRLHRLRVVLLRNRDSMLHLRQPILILRNPGNIRLRRRDSILHRQVSIRRLMGCRIGLILRSTRSSPMLRKGGDAVIVPAGSNLRVRINQGMSSKNTVPGSTFDGVVLNDVFAGNFIAIPRGASFQGNVVDAHTAGQLGGKGELKLQLTSVSFGGMVYPVSTDFWWHQGIDKTANTVGNTVGLASVGALIGAVAGGGVGAAIGAGVGGVAGLGVSSASGRGEASLPPEAIVTFHLTHPTDVTTVSQAELNRLWSSVPQPQMQRRYPPPPPPYPYPYYGPGYYYPR